MIIFKQKKGIFIFLLSFIMAYSLISHADIVLAGSVNANESVVISAAKGTFEYDGKTYVAKQEYIQQLTSKFSEDSIDLTADQASRAISQMYNNVGEGVRAGYLVQVDSDEGKDSSSNKNNSESQNKKSGEKDKSNTEGTENQPDEGENISNGKSSYLVPSIIKETGFFYFYEFTYVLLGTIAVVFLISIVLSVRLCRKLSMCGKTLKETANA